MTDEKSTSWWSTMPGLLTAAAAVITAITGLIIGLGQIGVFDGRQEPAATPSGVATTAAGSDAAARPAAEGAAVPGTSGPAAAARSDWTVTLPEQRTYRSGEVEYEILGATVRPDGTGQLALEASIRCTNHGRYALNFWDASFRLDAGGVSIAPVYGLNELVDGDSSKSGTVRFVLPSEVRDPVLRIKFAEGESLVPLVIAPA